MAQEKLRLAFAGRAPECAFFLEALSEPCCADLASLVAVAVSERGDPLLQEKLKNLSSPPRLYLRIEELLLNESLEAVIIATPAGLRANHAISALSHGCHVLLRSPPALTVRGVQRILKVQEQNHCFAAVYRSGKFGMRPEVLKWAVLNQVVGKPLFLVDLAFGLPGASPDLCVGMDASNHNRIQGGGILLLRGVRDMAFLRYVAGDVVEVSGTEITLEPERIIRDFKGKVLQRFGVQAEDTITAQLRFARGTQGLYLRSWCGRGEVLEPVFYLWGTKGCIRNDQVIIEGKQPFDLEEYWKDNVGLEQIEEAFPGGIRDPLLLELRAFLRCAASWGRANNKIPQNNLREALRDLSLAWALAESNLLGRRVSISEVETLAQEEAQRDLNARWFNAR